MILASNGRIIPVEYSGLCGQTYQTVSAEMLIDENAYIKYAKKPANS